MSADLTKLKAACAGALLVGGALVLAGALHNNGTSSPAPQAGALVADGSRPVADVAPTSVSPHLTEHFSGLRRPREAADALPAGVAMALNRGASISSVELPDGRKGKDVATAGQSYALPAGATSFTITLADGTSFRRSLPTAVPPAPPTAR